MVKKVAINFICDTLRQQQLALLQELNDLKLEMENDTKSSAGDKFETSREMAAQEFRRLQEQIVYKSETIKRLEEISNLSIEDKIQYGSFIKLNTDYILMAVGAGKFKIDGFQVMCLSLNSPFGKLLLGKSLHDTFSFNNNTFTIQSVE